MWAKMSAKMSALTAPGRKNVEVTGGISTNNLPPLRIEVHLHVVHICHLLETEFNMGERLVHLGLR
jgi:hypothetical protein